MTAAPAEPCPCELSSDFSSLGQVEDNESLVRFINNRDDLILEEGHWRPAPGSFSSSDINGSIGPGKKSVSTFRGGGTTNYSELVERACSKNKETDWNEDPVIGLVRTSAIRNIVDAQGRREFCVYADRTDDDDQHGISESHASIVKSRPANDKHQRQAMAKLRSQLSEVFYETIHLISGRSP